MADQPNANDPLLHVLVFLRHNGHCVAGLRSRSGDAPCTCGQQKAVEDVRRAFAALRASGTRPVMVHDDQLAAPQTPDLAALLASMNEWLSNDKGLMNEDVIEWRDRLAAALRTSPAPPIGWQDIATAPKDGSRIDVWAKAFLPAFDRFEHRRFADVYWWKGDTMGNSGPQWMNVDKDWCATHWMPLPAPPSRGIAQTGEP